LNPILSIVIATLDCAVDLDACLDSAQKVLTGLEKYEYEIIIKDCSSDKSVKEVFEKYELLLSLKYHHQKDSGIYDAWNQAMKHCHGQWIYFMGADDAFIEGFDFNNLREAFKTDDYPLISIPVMYVYGEETLVTTINKDSFLKKIRYSNPFHHQGIFHRAAVLKELEFDSKFKVSGDFDLMLKIIKVNPELILCLTSRPMVRMYSGGISSRIDTNLLRLKERAMVRANNGVATNHQIVILAYLAAYTKKLLSLFINQEYLANRYFHLKISAARIFKK
tara:strand:+ start:28257 stop:29090 length:834 start_codon:yes stop_codon:yes gene_type:complete